MEKIKIQDNVIVTDKLLPCPFCNSDAVMFLSENGNSTQKYYIVTVRCYGYNWVVKEIHKDGMTGLCRATMTEEYHLRAKSIEEIDEQDLEIAVELLTKRWNNRPKATERT
jgi:hypothetical protein